MTLKKVQAESGWLQSTVELLEMVKTGSSLPNVENSEEFNQQTSAIVS